jgi:hypothetical protein
MIGYHRLVLFVGIMCTVVGAFLILANDKIGGLLGYGIAVMVLGMTLVAMSRLKPRPAPPAGG